jgi:HemX protein
MTMLISLPIVSTLRILVPTIYGTVAVGYTAEFIKKRTSHFSWTLPVLAAGLAAHVLLFSLLLLQYRSLPYDTVFRGLLFCSLMVPLLYMGMEYYLREIRYGSFLFPFNFLVAAIAAGYLNSGVPLPEPLRSPYFFVHASLLFLAYTCFFLSFVISCMYLLQHRQIMHRRLGGLFERLPALADMDRSVMRINALGLGLLAAGIISGFLWMAMVTDVRVHIVHKIGFSVATAIIYLSEQLLRRARGWHGRRACLLSAAGFSFVIFTLLAGRHGY